MAAESWMKWRPSAWRADAQLRLCSLAARGLWIDLIGYMHEAVPYGFLLVNGEQPTCEEVADLVSVRNVRAVREAMGELEQRKVFSRDENGRIFSRRMVRDAERQLRNQVNGQQGGSPLLRMSVIRSVNREIDVSVNQDVNQSADVSVNQEDKVSRAGPRDRLGAQTGEQGSVRVPDKSSKALKTKSKAKATREPFSPPDWVPFFEWEAFDSMRKAKSGKAWTDNGRRFAINTLEKLKEQGQDPAAVLRMAVERTWSGLFPLKDVGGGSVDEWWKSNESILAKQKELGMSSRAGESWKDLIERIRQRIRETKK